MIKLRTALQAYLKTKHPRVYFQAAPENAQYPYLVYDFPNTFDDGEASQTVTVDVDGWDAPAGGDTTELETLMETVNGNGTTGLNKKTLTTDDIVVTFYLDNKIPLTDDDKRIRRRKYIYQAKLFERS
jgi:hypothetical protein